KEISCLSVFAQPGAAGLPNQDVGNDSAILHYQTVCVLFPHTAVLASRWYSHGKQETDEEFDARWVTYFNKPDIDAWELRKGMNTLIGYDLVPEPKILEAALRACRRLNDLASAIRILEAVKEKAGPHKDIYPYVIQELRPTLDELGISTPEDLGIDKV
uniref:Cytochrome c oxidase subunit 5A, mitochondrial n=1 Tax=Anabas testudineus TaxID=64144 RepID=A0A3Q1JZX5_ANATE